MLLPGTCAAAALRHGGQALHPVGARTPCRTQRRRSSGGGERMHLLVGGVEITSSGKTPWPRVLLCLARWACWVTQGPLPSPPHPRQLREPEGVKTSCWQQWHHRQQTAGRRLGEAARRLARGCGLWEGALYEIGGRTRTPIPTSCLPSLESQCLVWKPEEGIIPLAVVPLHPHQPTPPSSHIPLCPQSHPSNLGG